MVRVTRRTALVFAGAAGLAAHAAPARASQSEDLVQAAMRPDPVFAHGIASGDPQADSVILWTRVSTAADREPVRWTLARDAGMSEIVAEGEADATAEADHTVKVLAEGLEPGATYFYRFEARGARSPVGRTRTLPVGRAERLGVALVSCSNWSEGYFNAYEAIARDAAVDLVLHTGDYIYEGGGYTGRARDHAPNYEIVTLADYRERHAQYKTDAGALAMFAMHPFTGCWDDHESTNNPWMGGADNHQPETEGDWPTRRDASIRAYYEWLPIREPAPGRTRMEFWRSYSWGDLATLVTLETRHTARGEQIDLGAWVDRITTPEARDAFMTDIVDDPARRMISPAMEDEVRAAFSASVAGGQPWRLLGNASPIARMNVPDLEALGIDFETGPDHEKLGAGASLAWRAKWNLPFYTDTWDGYTAAREDFYALCRQAGASGMLFLTGDSHSFWANTLFDAEGRSVGLEIGTGGVTSRGDFVASGWTDDQALALDRAFEAGLPEVRWTDNMHQGYVRVELTHAEAVAVYLAVRDDSRPNPDVFELRRERILREGDTVVWA